MDPRAPSRILATLRDDRWSMERSAQGLVNAPGLLRGIGPMIELGSGDHVLDLTDVEADLESLIARWMSEGNEAAASHRGEPTR